MSNAIEIEAKALVNKDEYKVLTKKFAAYPRFTQTNHYIDTEERALAKEGIGLRIREKDDQYELTLKTPLSQGLLEKNVPITMNEFVELRDDDHFPENDLKRFLLMLDFDVEALKILTSLSTERIEFPYEGGILSIDKNSYGGKVDYEIEFEYNNMEDAKKILGKLLEDNGIKAEFSELSKTQRAFSTI